MNPKKLLDTYFPWLSHYLNRAYKKIDNHFSANELDEISRLQKIIKSKETYEHSLQQSIQLLREKEGENTQKIKELEQIAKNLIDKIKPIDIPSADITYQRPVLVGEKKFESVKIDVRNFIMPDFLIEKELKKRKLVFNGTQDLDYLIPKIYKLAKKNYKYGYDNKYGFSEYWMFPYELRAVRNRNLAADCDDWANWIGSHLAAANIPRNQWLISVGWTRSNIGHATLYCKASDNNWYHLNSTKPDYSFDDLKGFPNNKDKTDKIGIKENGFWFSYNDLFSIHKFENTTTAREFKKQLGKKIKIERR